MNVKLRLLLSSLLIILLLSNSANATSSDWFEDSVFNTTIWEWVNPPTNSYDIGTTLHNYMFVNTTNDNNPDETSSSENNLSIMTYQRQPVVDSEFNVSLPLNAYLQSTNYEIVALVLENDSSNHISINVLHNYNNKDIRFDKVVSGSKTQIVKTTSIPQLNTSDMLVKFEVYDDAGTTKINTSYILNDGIVVSQSTDNIVPFDINYVGIVYSSNSASDTSSYVKAFIWNDEENPSGTTISLNIDLTDGTSNSGKIELNNVSINISALYDYIESEKGTVLTESDYISKIDNNTWNIKALLYSDDGGELIADSKEIRFSREVTAGYNAVQCTINFKDTIVNCWDNTNDTYITTGFRNWMFESNSNLNNVTFNSLRKIFFGSGTNPAENITMNDVFITNWYEHITMYGDNWTVDNLHMVDANRTYYSNHGGITDGILNNSVLNDIYINSYESFDKPTHDITYNYGIHIGGFNNSISNVHVENSIYSGLVYFGSNSTLTNVLIKNCEHNSIETRTGSSYVVDYNIWDNVTIIGGNGTGIYDSALLITADEGNPMNGTIFRNLTINHDGTGGAIKLSGETGGVNGFLFENVIIERNPIFFIGGVHDSVFINMSMNVTDTSNSIQWTSIYSTNDNITFIDTIFGKPQYINGSSNIKFANTDEVDIYVTFDDSNYTMYYLINPLITNTTNYLVNEANIYLNSTIIGLDGDGNDFTNATTNENGILNYSERRYVPYFTRDSVDGYTYYNESTIFVDKDGKSNESEFLLINNTWHSTDLNNINSPIIKLMLDVEGTGEIILSIISSTPTNTTIYSIYGTEQTFFIETNKECTISFYNSSNLLQTTTSTTNGSYTSNSTMPVGTYNLNAHAYDNDTNTAKEWIWIITEPEEDEQTYSSIGGGLPFIIPSISDDTNNTDTNNTYNDNIEYIKSNTNGILLILIGIIGIIYIIYDNKV